MKAKITDEQLKDELNAGLSNSKIAKKYDMDIRSVEKRRAKLARSGWSPEHDMNHQVPEGFYVKGTSTLYKDGDPVIQWVKSNIDHEWQLEMLQEAIENVTSEVLPLPEIDYTGTVCSDDQFSVFPIGDPHIGLLTWEREVGESWDVKIAQRVFEKVFQRLLSMMPITREAILINTGDLFHSDNIQGTTSRSGHRLDLDGRHGKWIDAGLVIVRMWIETLLSRYERVHYVNVIGNHDDILGRFMGSFVRNLYENNPRLTCQVGDNTFQYVQRDKVLLGFTHGHTARLNSLPGKMADEVPELWGQTIFRHWITGHVHHNQFVQFKEHPGCSVESVGIIPPKDAYAHGGAYGARRGTQGLIFDSKYGELSMRRETNVRGTD